MKIPPQAMEQIKKAVMAMMPYESGYRYVTKEAAVFNRIFQSIQEHEPQFEEWTGFAMFLSKKIDTNESTQKSVHAIVLELDLIIQEYLNEK